VNTRYLRKLLIPCLLVAGFTATDAVALTRPGQTSPVPVVDLTVSARVQKDGVSLDEAVSIVRKRYGGRVINARTSNDNGRKVHVIKILSDEGRVREVRVDAQSGNLL
jgi:hypothetical protein